MYNSAGSLSHALMTPPSVPSSRTLLLLVFLAALAWFGNLEYRKLVGPDEGRYAEIPREMVVSGDWLTPRLNGLKYFEKPPLQYWTTAAAFTLFGEYHWATRLWTALTGFLGILAVYFTGRRLFGPEAGLYGALVLASSLLYVLIGHINTLDMGVTFFMTLGLAGFLLAQHGAASGRERRNWMWLTWAALALSVLSKGLMGVVLPGAVLVIYSLVERDFSVWRRLHIGSGIALFLAIAAPWFVAVSIVNPEFFRFFFIHEHFERFLTKAHGRYHPWWYFVPVFLAGILPWLTLAFDTLVRAWKQESGSTGKFRPQRFLFVWAVFIYFFFSISSSKLPSYILPVFPALALLMGYRLTQIDRRTFLRQTAPVAILAAAALALAPKIVSFASEAVPAELYSKYAEWGLAAAALWLAATAVALYFGWRDRIPAALVAFAAGGLIAGQLILTGHESLSPEKSSYQVAQKVIPHLKPGAPFYSVGMYEQTLPFYIKRTVILVAHESEMAFGLTEEPGKGLPDPAAFAKTWREQPYALAVMPLATYRQFQRDGLPMEMIASNLDYAVVKKP